MRTFSCTDVRVVRLEGAAADLAGVVAQGLVDDLDRCAGACRWRGARAGTRSTSSVSRSAVGLDDGVHPVAEVVVGQADHRARPHRRVLLQRRLDLGRVDVGAAAQDHVGEPVAEVEEAVGVEPAEVAERLPAAVAGARLGADVAVAGGVAGDRPQPHLALLAGGQLVALVVGDQHRALRGAAHRAAVLEPLRAGDDRGGLRLGAGVELPDPLRSEPLDPRLLEPRRARLGEVPHDLQRREVVALPHLGRAAARCASSSWARGRRPRPSGSRWPRACPRRRSGAAPPGARRPAGRRTTRRPGRCGTAGPASRGSRPRRCRAATARRDRWSRGRPTRSASAARSSRPRSGAFHAGEVASGSGPSSIDGWGTWPDGQARPARERRRARCRRRPSSRPARRWPRARRPGAGRRPAAGWRRPSSTRRR